MDKHKNNGNYFQLYPHRHNCRTYKTETSGDLNCSVYSTWNEKWTLCIGECPSNSPFLKNNGAEAPKGQRPIVFKEWRDTKTFSIYRTEHWTRIHFKCLAFKIHL
jgi:hypothetical protein